MNIVMQTNLKCILLLCLLAACKKDPISSDKPGWLLTKTIIRTNTGKPEWEWHPHYIEVNEYKYNQYNKPWLHLYYANGADSTNLLLQEADTLYYDEWKRVKQVSHYQSFYGKTTSITQYLYNGRDKLPAMEKLFTMYDSLNNGPYPELALTYRSHFRYEDTAVYQVRITAGAPDSIRFSYDFGGNHKRTEVYLYHLHQYGWDDLFTTYNSAPNPELFFNLDHRLIFRIDNARFTMGVPSPIISKHTWTTYYNSNDVHYAGPTVVRSIIRNSDGLVVKTISPYRDYADHSPEDVDITYEYTKVK
jgi:hypothetical protein